MEDTGLDQKTPQQTLPDRKFRAFFLVGLGILFFYFCYKISEVLNPLLIALMLAYIFNPIVSWFEKKGYGRTTSIVILFSVLFVGMALVFLVTVPLALGQLSNLTYMALGDPIGNPERVADELVEKEKLSVAREAFTDENENGRWDPAEKFKDDNGNGVQDPGEMYTDPNDNKKWDPAEPFVDISGNGIFDEKFFYLDANDNHEFNPGEKILDDSQIMRRQGYLTSAEPFEDDNSNGKWDEGEEYFDLNMSGTHDELIYYLDGNRNSKLDVGYVDSFQQVGQGILGWVNTKLKSMGAEEIDAEQVGADFKEKARDNMPTMVNSGLSFSTWAAGRITSGISTIVYLVFVCMLIPLYTFFLMRNLDQVYRTFVNYLPSAYRGQIVSFLQQIHVAMSGFFRGMLFICVLKAIVYSIALAIIGAPFAIILGILAGLLTVIPIFGAHSVMIFCALITFVDSGTNDFVAVLALWAVVETLDGVVLQPTVLGKNVELHPIFIIMAVSIGASLLGLFGALIAVPSAAIIKISIKEFVAPALKEFADGGKDDDDEPGEPKAEKPSKSSPGPATT